MRSKDSTSKTTRRKASTPKFPLCLHPSKQWCKKIRGRIHYFGKDRDQALERWMREKDDLLAGRTPSVLDPDGLKLLDLCNRFLASKEAKRDTGEITAKHWENLKTACTKVMEVFGQDKMVESLHPEDFARLRSELAKGKRIVKGKRVGVSLKTLENDIARIRVLFNFAAKNGLILKNMALFWGTEFDKPTKKAQARVAAKNPIVRMFAPAEIHRLIELASPQMKAMIYLGLNCGLGNTDIGLLERHHIRNGWLRKARSKTGKDRKVPLWPETLKAIEAALEVRPKNKDASDDDKVFITKYGSSWTPTGKADPISQQFTKIRKAAGIKARGKSFYTLRHCFQTIGDETLDFVAVKFMMGHDGTTISNEYREGISDDRLRRVTDHVRQWFLGGKAGA